MGVPAERVLRKGKKDNFWGPPGASGSCGPCSEIHYDLGEDLKCSDDCGIDTCECDIDGLRFGTLCSQNFSKTKRGNNLRLIRKTLIQAWDLSV